MSRTARTNGFVIRAGGMTRWAPSWDARILLIALTTGGGLFACSDSTAPPAALNGADAGALVRTAWPSAADPGPPAYARIEPVPPHVYHDDEWAVIVFYREPDCVPADFNLLAFFAAPAAFGCTLTVEGTTHWQDAPFSGPPMMTHARGLEAVPIWFVPLAAIQPALQDGTLTIGELAALEGLVIGHADQFRETLQPVGGPHPSPKLIVNAHGGLADGRRFRLHLTSMGLLDVNMIRIQFR